MWYLVPGTPLYTSDVEPAAIEWPWTYSTKGLWAHDLDFKNIYVALTRKKDKILGQNFAYTTRAELPWHAQFYDSIAPESLD